MGAVISPARQRNCWQRKAQMVKQGAKNAVNEAALQASNRFVIAGN